MDETYDVVVLGTGMIECVLSGLLSVAGKKVLHTDKNPYYGGESASMNLNELYKKFKGSEAPKELGESRKYCVDLILKFIMADDGLVKKLRCSKVYQYLTFQKIDGSHVYRGGKVYKVPVTDKEVLTSSLLGLFQKKYLRSLLVALDDCDLANNQVPQGITPETTMLNVYKKYGLDNDNMEMVGHVIALHQNDEYLNQPCIETFKRIDLYKRSLMINQQSPYIYPEYGLGELPQAFARLSAVYGGTYMLQTECTGLEFGPDGKVNGVRFGENVVKTSCVIADPTYFPEKVKKVKQVVRCICILNHPVKSIAPCESGQIIIPAGQTKRNSDIYVSVISPNFNTSPQGIYIAIVVTVVESQDPKSDVKVGVDLLTPIIDQFISTYDVYEPVDDGTATNVFF